MPTASTRGQNGVPIMIEPILGSRNAERVLLFVLARDQGYTREIARFWGSDPDSIQKQLARLECGGVLDSRTAGKTRIFKSFSRKLLKYSRKLAYGQCPDIFFDWIALFARINNPRL